MNRLQRIAVDAIAHAQPAAMDAWAVARVEAMGRAVLPVRAPPEIGSVWAPGRSRAEAREIVAFWRAMEPPTIGYRLLGRAHHQIEECTLATWRRWVRRTRAVRSDAGERS